jgi:hypothetical protein
LLSLPRLPKWRILGKESLIDYSSSHVMTFDQYLAVFKQKIMDKDAWTKLRNSSKKKEGKNIKKVSKYI